MLLAHPVVLQALLRRHSQRRQDTTTAHPILLSPAELWDDAVKYGFAPFLGGPNHAFAHEPLYGHPSNAFAGNSVDMLVSRMERASLSSDDPLMNIGMGPGDTATPRYCPSIAAHSVDPQSLPRPSPRMYTASDKPPPQFGLWESYWETDGAFQDVQGALPLGGVPKDETCRLFENFAGRFLLTRLASSHLYAQVPLQWSYLGA